MPIKASELILNPDGSIYHLNLKPEHIAATVILVGDQDRVSKVSAHFDTIEFTRQKREFKTQTGRYKGKRITVISTGIGCDNIDIVLNELDALVNINLETRTVKEQLTSLNIIRIGTSGALQQNIPVDSFLINSHGLDFSGMPHFYKSNDIGDSDFEKAFITQTNWSSNKSKPIAIAGHTALAKHLESNKTTLGITATASGFYGPQGRTLRLALEDDALNDKIQSFNYKELKITNLEMETAAIYALSTLLGHKAISINAIIANRAAGTFSEDPDLVIEQLISYTLGKIVSL